MDKTTHKKQIHTEPERIGFEFLDPASVHFHRGPTGTVRLCVDGHDRSYLKVAVGCAFPLSQPDWYVGFLDEKSKDIGTVKDLTALDPESQEIVRAELRRRYFLPKILRITQLKHEYDISYFEVETDHGNRDFSMRGHRENCQEISPGRFLIEDVDGNRFEIVSLYALDKRSQDLLGQVV